MGQGNVPGLAAVAGFRRPAAAHLRATWPPTRPRTIWVLAGASTPRWSPGGTRTYGIRDTGRTVASRPRPAAQGRGAHAAHRPDRQRQVVSRGVPRPRSREPGRGRDGRPSGTACSRWWSTRCQRRFAAGSNAGFGKKIYASVSGSLSPGWRLGKLRAQIPRITTSVTCAGAYAARSGCRGWSCSAGVRRGRGGPSPRDSGCSLSRVGDGG